MVSTNSCNWSNHRTIGTTNHQQCSLKTGICLVIFLITIASCGATNLPHHHRRLEFLVGDVAAVVEEPPTVLELFETGVRHQSATKPVFLEGNGAVEGASIVSIGDRIGEVAIGGNQRGSCRIEYQVTETVEGRCERLGRSNVRACISDEHMEPFHPECMV